MSGWSSVDDDSSLFISSPDEGNVVRCFDTCERPFLLRGIEWVNVCVFVFGLEAAVRCVSERKNCLRASYWIKRERINKHLGNDLCFALEMWFRIWGGRGRSEVMKIFVTLSLMCGIRRQRLISSQKQQQQEKVLFYFCVNTNKLWQGLKLPSFAFNTFWVSKHTRSSFSSLHLY